MDSPTVRADEAAEEEAEDYGKKLVNDIEAAGATEGMDAGTSRRVAGAFFSAAAKCLGAVADTASDEPERKPVVEVEEEVGY